MFSSIGAVTTLMVGFLIMMLVYYERSMAEINKAKQDIDTVTVTDFTVELDISKENYEYFKNIEFE